MGAVVGVELRLSARSTLEVRFGEFGWKFPRLARVDQLPMTDQTTRLVRGSVPVSAIDRSHHKNVDLVYSSELISEVTSAFTISRLDMARFGTERPTRVQPAITTISIRSGRTTSPPPLFIETMDTPFTQENRSMQHSLFASDSWAYKRLR